MTHDQLKKLGDIWWTISMGEFTVTDQERRLLESFQKYVQGGPRSDITLSDMQARALNLIWDRAMNERGIE